MVKLISINATHSKYSWFESCEKITDAIWPIYDNNHVHKLIFIVFVVTFSPCYKSGIGYQCVEYKTEEQQSNN